MSIANSREKVPKSVYYTFDAIKGDLRDPSGIHWSPYNPDYDPGPPPPLQPPKAPTTRDIIRANATSSHITTYSMPGASVAPPTMAPTGAIPSNQGHRPQRYPSSRALPYSDRQGIPHPNAWRTGPSAFNRQPTSVSGPSSRSNHEETTRQRGSTPPRGTRRPRFPRQNERPSYYSGFGYGA